MKGAILADDGVLLPGRRRTTSLARAAGAPSAGRCCMSATPRPPGRTPNRPCTCTASAAPRRTSPTWPACSPTGSTRRPSTCPASATAIPSPRYSIPALAATLIGYLEHDGRGPVHLVGNSLGGSIAVRVAALRPDLIRTLTLISPAMPFLDPRRTAHGPVLPLLALPRAERLFAWGMARLTVEQMAEQVLMACFGDTTKVSAQRRAEAIEEIKLRYTVAHYPQGLSGHAARPGLQFPAGVPAGRRARSGGWPPGCTAPTLVIGGLNDKLVDPRVPAQVARVDPGQPAADPAPGRARGADGGAAAGRPGDRRPARRHRLAGGRRPGPRPVDAFTAGVADRVPTTRRVGCPGFP